MNCRSAIHYVMPNKGYNNNNSNNGNWTLQYYLSHAKKYFTSDTQLCFLPGCHELQDDMVISNVKNFSIKGGNSKISCNKNVGIVFINVTRLTLHNIMLTHCNKNYSQFTSSIQHIFFDHIFMHESYQTTPDHWTFALYMHHSALLSIKNVLIAVDIGVNGLLVTNVYMQYNEFINVTVQVNCSLLNNTTTSLITNGIMLLYFDWNNTINGSILIKNYTYKPENSCSSYSLLASHFAMQAMLTQTEYSTNITMKNSIFTALHNVSILNFYGESHGLKTVNRFSFTKCRFHKNTNHSASLVKIIIHSKDILEKQTNNKLSRHKNLIIFMHCSFLNNSNIRSLLHIVPMNTLITNVHIIVNNSNFSYNNAQEIIKVTSEVIVLWHLSFFLTFDNTVISFNTHQDGISVLSASNGIVSFQKVTIKSNKYFYSIIYLHLSLLKLFGQCQVFHNEAKFILMSSQGSYYLLSEYSALKITENLVSSVLSQSLAYNERHQSICYFQFTSKRGNLDEVVMQKHVKLNYTIDMIDNIYTGPIFIINSSFSNCTWLGDTAFQTTPATKVFNKVINRTLKVAEKENFTKIPADICQCDNITEYNCRSREIGLIFPGQTLRVNFILPNLKEIPYSSTQLIAKSKNLPYNGCQIDDVQQIVQEHPSHGCNQYNYTLWSSEKTCELYLESEDIDTFLSHFNHVQQDLAYKKQDKTLKRVIVTLF